MRTPARAACLACALLPALPARATPYVPARGDEVIERLPRRADPLQQELRRMRADLGARPRDLTLATRLAQRYITLGRGESDPRYFGYAQAALAPWWMLPAPPPAVRLLRAMLLQGSHHFAEALADLDAVVAAQPGNAQAWLTRATVQAVRGDYAGATASCARVAALASQLVAVACLAQARGVTAGTAAPLLEAVLERSGPVDDALRAWVLTLLAELAVRRGDAGPAEARFRMALGVAPRDAYLLGAYADFLLDQGRPREAVQLVQRHTRVDALLLRYALALRRLPGQRDAAQAASAELAARFDAGLQRGDRVHQREQARYALHLQGDARAALALARQNWEVQKEPADMRILLEAALAAGDRAAAAPVLLWMRQNRVQDLALRGLAAQLARGG
ncbi:MAG: tetratricopeptide repeat protein [Massilia sp.]